MPADAKQPDLIVERRTVGKAAQIVVGALTGHVGGACYGPCVFPIDFPVSEEVYHWVRWTHGSSSTSS